MPNPGQTATRSLEVTELEIRVERDDGEVVLEGEAWCYTLRPGARTAP